MRGGTDFSTPPPIPERNYYTDTSSPPLIPERNYGTKQLPPIPSLTPNSQTVVGKRPRPAAPPSLDVDPGYEECRPVAVTASGGGLREFGDYEIAPYAESVSVLQKSLRYADDYEIAPYSESKPFFPELNLRRDSNTTSVDTSVTSEMLAGIYGEAIPVDTSVTSKKFAGIYGEAVPVDTSLLSDNLAATYIKCRPRLSSPRKLPKDNGKATENAISETDRSTPTHLLQFKQISEVPPSLDLSSLSVVELTHCLNLLGLSKYSDVFRENDVDGTLASEFNIETLVGSFNFSDFEAMKFIKFFKGWRPNMK